MRISYWSSDVCSSDLPLARRILQDSIMFDRDQMGAEKAFQASAFDGANEKIAHFDLEIMIAGDVGPEAAWRPVCSQPGIDFGFGPQADLMIVVRPARSLVARVKGKPSVDPDLGDRTGVG